MGEANGSFCICAVTCLSTHLVAQPSASVEAGVSLGFFFFTWFQIDDGSGMKREATVDEVIKIVEELTRIH